MKLTSFLTLAFGVLVAALPSKKSKYPDLFTTTIPELQSGLSSGLFTSVDLTKAYIARINEMNTTLHMVTEINPDALSVAYALDKERAAYEYAVKHRHWWQKPPTPLTKLHGIPILIKNNIATHDKMGNTAGSFSLYGAKVPRDAGVAKSLKAAGAIILGKTNLSQWANYRSSNSSNGWSAYGGQTYGAYVPNQDPSGSSSGSGVSSSIGLALAALGTETSGSILSPSQQNNLCGIKPTVGLTSRNLVIPISEHQDTVGPMARTCYDAAAILSVIAGYDPYDNYTSAIPFRHYEIPDYTKGLKTTALRGVRLGVPRNSFTGTDANSLYRLSTFNSALDVLSKSLGAHIVDNTNYTAFASFRNSTNSGIVLGADFVADLKKYLAELTYNPNAVHNLPEVRAFTQSFPQEDYPDRNTATWDANLALGYDNTDARFWAAYQNNLFLGSDGGIKGAIETHKLDALVVPTAYAPGIAAIVGYPVVTVPLGALPPGTNTTTNARGLVTAAPNLPFGLAFIGLPWTEAKLISYAYAWEQKTHVRDKISPYIKPKTQLADVVKGW